MDYALCVLNLIIKKTISASGFKFYTEILHTFYFKVRKGLVIIHRLLQIFCKETLALPLCICDTLDYLELLAYFLALAD
ncbi:MAG: hypothetical protein RL154_1418 [Pseudomonadota bacterium]